MYEDKKPFHRLFAVTLLLALSLFFSCKKSPTAPQIEDTSRPVIWLNQEVMTFTTSESGGNPASQTLIVKNAGPGTLDYAIEADADWIDISPATGSSTGQVTEHKILVNKTGLQATETGHEATLSVKCSQAYNNPQQMRVHFNIMKGTPPKIWIETQSFNFNAQEGGPNPSSQNLRIKNDGPGTLNYELSSDVSWIYVNPSTGTCQDEFKVHELHVDTTGLASGTYNGKISVLGNNAANSPQTIAITLNIDKKLPPRILLSTNNLTFTSIEGGADPPSKSFTVSNSGGGVLKYTIDWDANWLVVTPDSGESGGAKQSHTVSVNSGGLNAGNYQGTITVTDSQASNTPQQISVALNIDSLPTENSISISCSPTSGKTNTIVSFPVTIRGNQNEISVFGLDLTFNASIFALYSIEKGSLTGGWTAVDGNEISPGTVKLGGFAGSANPIPVSSVGTIFIVKLKVISTASTNMQPNVWIKNYIDHLQGMTPLSTFTTFSYLK